MFEMMSLTKNRPPNSLIGLKLERNRLEGVVLRRNGGGLQVQRSFQASLSLDPLTNDPELVGREIRNHLNEAGVRERRCAVCLPLSWTLTLQTKVPEIPEGDVSSFLGIEAEKGFPYSPEDLSMSTSRYGAPGGEQHATIVAIPLNQLNALQRVLKAAQLKPLSFSLAISALQTSNKEDAAGVISLLVGENNVELEVSSGKGVLALRSLEGAVETEGNQKQVDADLVAREIKITLGQLPRVLSETVRRIQVFGRPEMVNPLVKEIRDRAANMGLTVEAGGIQQINGFPLPLPMDKSVSPALSMAARHLLGHSTGFEFLPPTVSAWPKTLARFSSRKLFSAGAAGGAIALLVGGMFFVQHLKLSSLQKRWRAIQPKVTKLESLQNQIRKFRPWFDNSLPTLTIMRKLTETFPVDGDVYASRVEVKDLSVITCTGKAKDYASFQKMMEQLRAVKEVADLKQDQLQGNSPLQFSINFRWVEGASHD